MKKIKISLVSALIVLVSIISGCSKTEDFSAFVDQGGSNEDPVASSLLFRKSSLRNQQVTFTLTDENGEDISDLAVFYVDGEALDANVFSSPDTGMFEVYAEFDDNGNTQTTETETFNIIIPKQKIAVEDYTGTWCGYCPRVTASIEAIHEVTDDIAVVAIHNDDEMAIPIEEDLRNEFGVFGFPAGRINRTVKWENPQDPQDVISIAGVDTDLAIAITSSVTGNNLNVKVTVASENDIQNTKLVVYLVEDNIIADQVNYYDNDPTSPYYQQGNPIVDFVHNDVLRAALTDAFGNAVSSTAALEDYNASYQIALSPEFVVANLKIVAMIVEQDNTALNAQYVKVGEEKPFE
ncbi:MAG: Omp28-related outer membrane protein [Bacteroidia bacterium]|nr:Omp28-related outer membrane protein [Bacteroidia bacterium]NNF29923.1 Omp28-related outer membrane protein [Flavobacteriaceae bacterium]MBT8275834.1 Omp28-related outer membrane protein [Bacteroidia bacterium]NNJ81146.1 Omp28-related outer membrane protein [Flavobacteriaceae bacterium]NNK53385.1 Omp28-related outer membrane protein [Flavobacteriaceae bacterium]